MGKTTFLSTFDFALKDATLIFGWPRSTAKRRKAINCTSNICPLLHVIYLLCIFLWLIDWVSCKLQSNKVTQFQLLLLAAVFNHYNNPGHFCNNGNDNVVACGKRPDSWIPFAFFRCSKAICVKRLQSACTCTSTGSAQSAAKIVS